MDKHYRQGDVLVIPISGKTPKGAAVAPKHGRLILAEGEATGHHHSVPASAAQLFAVDERMVLVVAEPTRIEHQEHAAIEIAPGDYWVVRQREYTPQAIRRVMD